MGRPPLSLLAAGLVAIGLLFSGGAGVVEPSAAAVAAAPEGSTLVATARGVELRVHGEPGGGVTSVLANPGPTGGPLVLMVEEARRGWLRVQLPTRPNGSSGWVEEDDVSLGTTPWRLVVFESSHRLEVFRDGRWVARYPVGVGREATPTVSGSFYVTELIRPPDPTGMYGPYAFGLSAHSDVLASFAGGPGQLGLHGTDEPGRVGTDVSHGCLRVTNDVIRQLASQIPLGTPVDIWS